MLGTPSALAGVHPSITAPQVQEMSEPRLIVEGTIGEIAALSLRFARSALHGATAGDQSRMDKLPMKNKKLWLAAGVAAAVIIAVLLVAARRRNDPKADRYRTEPITKGDVAMTVTATGTLSAVTTVQVGSQVSGVISRLYADFNSQVRRGQLLAELDPTPFEAQVEQRRADLTRTTVEMRNAEVNLNRQRRLVEQGLSSQAEYDAARAAYESARAQVAQAAAALRQSETNLRYTKILSPIDGVVADRQYDVGQTVAASFQAPTLFTIAQDLTKMQVQADVDQSDIGRVRVGQTTRFTVDAYPEEEFQGRIKEVRLNATVNQTVVSYPVIIEVANPEKRLRPKMTANVTIEVARVADVMRVANAALRFRPETGQAAGAPDGGARAGGNREGFERTTARTGDQRGFAGASQGLGAGRRARPQGHTVYTLDAKGQPKAHQVRTGITDGKFTQLIEGDLTVGEKVLVGLATSKADQTPPPGGARMGRF